MTTTSDTTNLMQLSAVEQAALVRSGELSARELVSASLAQIERVNPSVNAFVAVCSERALVEADAIRAGDQRPLCGVPLACKDLLGATAGLPTTEGSAAFGDWVADHDTAHVRRLREAGAIVIGKTNTPELGLRPVTENQRFGPTRNPWRTTLSAGGSSGGSAAAVAAGMAGLAEGSDLGGSLRIPAACCGVIALKPSRGRVSIGPDYGDIAGGAPVDGPIARTTLDAAVALDAMAGYEPGDHHWIGPATRSFADAAQHPPGRVTVRVATHAPLGVQVDTEPLSAAQRASEALADLGHEVDEGAPDWDDESFPPAWSTFVTGAVQHLVRVLERLHGRPVDGEQLEPATRAWILDSAPVTLIEYLEAKEQLIAFSRRIMRSWPADSVLLTPTLTRLPAPIGGIASQSGVTDDAVRFSALVRIWNVTGQPAMSLPLHETPEGIPVGVQLIAPPGREDLLVGLAAQLEQSVGWHPQLPQSTSHNP